jgi:mannosylglucosylglycerate synthase
LNIIMIHYAAPPIVGGVESVMARHARLMTDAGHRVCIIAGRGQETTPGISLSIIPEVDSRHPDVLTLKAELDAGHVPAAFDVLLQRLDFLLQANIGDADFVIAHNVCSLNKNLALTAALHRMSERNAKPRFILWHHDLAWTTPRYRDELHDGYPWNLLRIDWPWADQVVVSEQRRQELASLINVPPQRIRVIPNGVDVGEFLKFEDETKGLVEKLGLSSAAPLLLLPVRITPRKNIELALRVLAALRAEFPAARLLVTGPLGPHNPANESYFERLRAMRKELQLDAAAVFLTEVVENTIPDAAMADLYKLADLLFFPSREEGFGIPVLEAGLTGIPIFCSDIPALREIGRSEVHYFSPDAAPDELAGQIASMLRSNANYVLRKRVLTEYTWDEIYKDRIAPLLHKD